MHTNMQRYFMQNCTLIKRILCFRLDVNFKMYNGIIIIEFKKYFYTK